MKRKPKLTLLGLTVENARSLPAMLNSLEPMLEMVDWRGFVCLPAKDEGIPVLKKWNQSHDGALELIMQPEILPATRYAKMAHLRNLLLKHMRAAAFKPDFIFSLDMDIAGFTSLDGMEQAFGSQEWDVVAVRGLVRLPHCHHDLTQQIFRIADRAFSYFDWLALETKDRERVLWRTNGSRNIFQHGKVPRGTIFVSEPPLLPDEWMPVNSAFGPAALYRAAAVEDLWYDENTQQCEHQGFHERMRAAGHDRIFLAHDIVALYDGPSAVRRLVKPTLWHVYSSYNVSGDTLRRHLAARESWESEYRFARWKPRPVTDGEFTRSSRTELGDTRAMPFIHDLIDRGIGNAKDGDVIVVTNDDTCFVDGITQWIVRAVEDSGACFAHRWDSMRLPKLLEACEIRSLKWYPGSDLFAFTAGWWKEHRHEYPDMVLGFETWDWIMRELIRSKGGREIYEAIYHEWHQTAWARDRIASPVNTHNRRLARAWLSERGIPMNEISEID